MRLFPSTKHAADTSVSIDETSLSSADEAADLLHQQMRLFPSMKQASVLLICFINMQ